MFGINNNLQLNSLLYTILIFVSKYIEEVSNLNCVIPLRIGHLHMRVHMADFNKLI